MGETELLEMLASETNRRVPAIIAGVRERAASSEPSGEAIEEVRVEVHGLKGAAMVVGETRLAELARQIEITLVQQVGPGLINPALAETIVAAVSALQAGVGAAAAGDTEPASVEASLASLRADA